MPQLDSGISLVHLVILPYVQVAVMSDFDVM